MNDAELIPHLFRSEYRKIVAVLTRLFGLQHIELAEDIVSDTFLIAAETWGLKGLPPNPTAWLYTVAKNKVRDALRRQLHFNSLQHELQPETLHHEMPELDLSARNINDSQLQMMFAICHPSISTESQISLALNILCGFGADEIAEAFLSSRDVVYKRLTRAKQRLRDEQITLELPSTEDLNTRMEAVLTTLYLLFSEGYYSSSPSASDSTLRKDLCLEAMRLNLMLVENPLTDTPQANALLSLMCFHSSRFEARMNSAGEVVLYEDQDPRLWNDELIRKGEYYLERASSGQQLSKFHIEAAIAYWHTRKQLHEDKWENILQLYNRLLQLEYSPIAALNRTYALSKARGTAEAIQEAEKLQLLDNHFYHSLLASLYLHVEPERAIEHYQHALRLARTPADKALMQLKLQQLQAILGTRN